MRKGQFSGPNARFQDITGQRFGKLVAIRMTGYNKWRRQLWEFRCDCGTVCIKDRNQVTTAEGTRSCGCNQFGHNKKHGKHGTREYIAWKAMRQRCNDPNSIGYPNYGGRGIKVCDRWDDFSLFFADIGPAPSTAHTPERIDNDGNYEPGNVRWATRAEQSRNTRVNHLLTFQGRTQPVVDWADELGLKRDTVYRRLYRGWSIEKTLTTPTN